MTRGSGGRFTLLRTLMSKLPERDWHCAWHPDQRLGVMSLDRDSDKGTLSCGKCASLQVEMGKHIMEMLKLLSSEAV